MPTAASNAMMVRRGVTGNELAQRINFANNNTIRTRTWKGSYDYIIDLYNYYTDLRWECDLQEGPNWILTVTEPQTAYVYEYDIDYNSTEKDLLESDHPVVASIPQDEILELQYFLDEPEKYIPELETTAALDVYSLLKNGIKSVIVDQQVVTRTYTIPYSGFIVSNKANDLKVLSANTLIAQAEIPDNYLDEILPTGTFLSVNGYDRDATRTPAQYGYLQRRAKTRQTIGQQIVVTQEWEYGLWSTVLYGAPI